MILIYGIDTVYDSWFVEENTATGFSRIYYIYSGEGFYEDENSKIVLQPFNFYVFPSTKPYKITQNHKKPLRCLFLHIVIPTYYVSRLCELPTEDNKFLSGCLSIFEAAIEDKNNALIDEAGTLFCLYMQEKNMFLQINPAFAEIVEYIDKNIASDITCKKLAQLSGYNRQYFISLFKEHIGLTPHQYIMNQRFKSAVRLILDGKTVTQAALLCGYSDLKTFSRAFKSRYKMSPDEWRKQYKPQP